MFYEIGQLKDLFDKVRGKTRKVGGAVAVLCAYDVDAVCSAKLLSVI